MDVWPTRRSQPRSAAEKADQWELQSPAEHLVMTAIAETWAVSCTLMSLQPFPELAASARATVCQESSMSLRLTEPLATTARSKVGYVSKEAAAWSQGLWDSS